MKLNYYRERKFGKKYLITTDQGSWTFLTKKELQNLKSEKITKKLNKKLEQAGIMITDKNIYKAVYNYQQRNFCLLSGTSLHIVVPTLRCNMNCIYCHASSVPKNSKGYDMDQKTAKKTVDFIFQSPSKAITIEFQGGEPLLNWKIIKFITNYVIEKNKRQKKELRLTIVTNLIKMNQQKMNFLIKKNIDICTSLDGPKELHDYNRRYLDGSSYDMAIKWIKKINNEYKRKNINKRVSALVTLTK